MLDSINFFENFVKKNLQGALGLLIDLGPPFYWSIENKANYDSVDVDDGYRHSPEP